MGLNVTKLDPLSERLIDFLARKASNKVVDGNKLKVVAGSSMAKVSMEVIESVAKEVTRVEGASLYCNLCGKGPFTKRGMYLHLTRLHKYELKALLVQELREKIMKSGQ
ncbi:MAG: hypothetical protein QXS42_00300 [Zestosphaera sp.]